MANEKIRIGNDIDIRWSLVDGDGNPYNMEGKDISIEIVVNDSKRVRIKQFTVSGNTLHFIYYGKDQKYLGSCDLKYIENDGKVEMVTFDTQAAFTMVPHSWLAVDADEQPERVYLEYTTVVSQLVDIGHGHIDIDDHLDLESENPVQNKVITAAILTLEISEIPEAGATPEELDEIGLTREVLIDLCDGKYKWVKVGGENYAVVNSVPIDETAGLDGNVIFADTQIFVPADEVYLPFVQKLVIDPESTSNKVTSISADRTHTQYPSAKAVYNALQPKYEKPGNGIPANDLADDAKIHLFTFDSDATSGTLTLEECDMLRVENCIVRKGNSLYYKVNGAEWVGSTIRYVNPVMRYDDFKIYFSTFEVSRDIRRYTFWDDGICANDRPCVYPNDYIEEGETCPTLENILIGDTVYLLPYVTKSVNDLVNYYLKDETYTRAEVEALIAAIQGMEWVPVDTLPTASASTMNKIYLVPAANPQTQNQLDEYYTKDNGSEADPRYTWELFGSAAIDLSGYATTQALNAAVAGMLKYTSQSLTMAQMEQARQNINADDVLVSSLLNPPADFTELSEAAAATAFGVDDLHFQMLLAGYYTDIMFGYPAIGYINTVYQVHRERGSQTVTFDAGSFTRTLTVSGIKYTLTTNAAQDISTKADKVTGATNGNFAGLDSNGNLVDSGKKASDFATAAQGTKADGAVRFDASQSLTDAQRKQARENLKVSGKLVSYEDSGATFTGKTFAETESYYSFSRGTLKQLIEGDYSQILFANHDGTVSVVTVVDAGQNILDGSGTGKIVYELDGYRYELTFTATLGSAPDYEWIYSNFSLTRTAIVTDISGKEDKSNKVTSFGSTPSDTKYPSEKLVKDSLDLKADVSGVSDVLRYSAQTLTDAQKAQALSNIGAASQAVIPSAASSSNQLADKAFVNSSISTATATYRGSYNLVSDLSLTVSATQSQVATALGTAISTADNNDYAFVQIPTSDATPTEIARVERYKYNGSAWAFEYALNNSGFTAAQWAALNSGITSGLVSKLSDLPTNSELTNLLAGKQPTIDSLHKLPYSLISDTPTIPAAVEANPTVPSGTTPTDLAGLKVGNSYYGIPQLPTVDNTPTANSNNLVKSSGVYSEIHPAVASTQPQGGFQPNIMYVLGEITGTVTFALAAAVSGIVNHYYWTFETGSTAPTITWPAGITAWNGGSAPTINASKHYEISVLNGIGVAMEA